MLASQLQSACKRIADNTRPWLASWSPTLSPVDDNNTHLTATFQDNRVTWYQNVSILDFIGAKDDGGGGDNWSYIGRAKLQSNLSPSANQHPTFYGPDSLCIAQLTTSECLLT